MAVSLERQKQIKIYAQRLVDSRRAIVMGDGACGGDASSFRHINTELEKLETELGISGAALEFWLHPVSIQGELNTYLTTSQPLTRAENAVEKLNSEWAQELKNAGLL